ncbi:MAG TPA: DUF1579 family protein [Pirellulaceae bacterium]|nr:DUF1579 family protein [Pirellulaceae bacterium]
MQKMIFTAIAYWTILASTLAQEPNDSSLAKESSPEHKKLHAFIGTWELSVSGVEQKGRAEIKPILGGLFITEDVTIPFGGFDMNWHGVLGYDRVNKQYTGVWFDNMNNITRSSSGDVDETGRVITFRGEQAGHGRFAWRISNDGDKAMTIEMFQVTEDGKESLVMSVRGTKLE